MIARWFASAFVAFAFASPLDARADTSTDVGIFAAVVAGQHVGSDNPVPVSGVVPGAALEFEQRVDRIRLHLEGIPTVGASGSNRGAFGHSSATLDLLNSVASYDLDANRRVSVGLGYQLVNLANTNGDNGDVNQVRIGSPIYDLTLRFPLAAKRGFETHVMIDPNLRGVLNVFTYQDVARTPKPERGAEIDYAADYRWERGPLHLPRGTARIELSHAQSGERGTRRSQRRRRRVVRRAVSLRREISLAQRVALRETGGDDAVMTLAGGALPAGARTVTYHSRNGALLRIGGMVCGTFDRKHTTFALPPNASGEIELGRRATVAAAKRLTAARRALVVVAARDGSARSGAHDRV